MQFYKQDAEAVLFLWRNIDSMAFIFLCSQNKNFFLELQAVRT